THADLSGAMRLTSSLLTSPNFTDLTAANGQFYYYAVTASYGGVESKLSAPASGEAYVAGYAANAAALDGHAIGTPVDTTITFTNTGTGFLKLNVWLGGDADANIDAVRISYPLAPIAAKPAAPGAARIGPQYSFTTMVQALSRAKPLDKSLRAAAAAA